MKKIFVLTLAFAISTGFVSAQTSESFQFMRVGRDAATMAMAGSDMGTTRSSAFAAYGNVAASAFADGKGDAAVSYQIWAPGSDLSKLNAISAGAAFKIGSRVTMAVAGNYDMGASYDVIDDYGLPQGSYRMSDMCFGVGVGVKVIDCLSIGVNARYDSQNIASDYAPAAFAADAYLAFKHGGWVASAGVSSLGACFGKGVSGSGAKVTLPSSARLGAGYTGVAGEKHSFTGSIDADIYFNKAFAAAAGFQYGYNDILFLRAGYRYATAGKTDQSGIMQGVAPVPSFASVGVGVKFFGVHLDAAYLIGKEVKNSICLTLGYAF